VIYIRKFRTRGVYTSKTAFRQETLNSLRRDVNPLVVRELDAIVADWDNQVAFTVIQDISQDGIITSVIPSGPGADIFNMVSRGTKAHWISVTKPTTFRGFKGYRPRLWVRRYAPRTSPHTPGAHGGPGQFTNVGVYRQRVYHKGAAPRNIERYVTLRVRDDFYRFIENALRRAVRRAQREGT
jgi:hypothetical protein